MINGFCCKIHKNDTQFLDLFLTGTVSVLYLIFLVTLKAIRLGFHLEFHWFMQTEYFVPGELFWPNKESVHLKKCDLLVNYYKVLLL